MQRNTAPIEMFRGSAAADPNFAYFTPIASKSVYRYTLDKDVWQKLPPCPYPHAGLIVIEGALTAVGGREGSRYTNKLVTLRQSQWGEEYPPMNTARSSPAVVSVSDGEHVNVVVIGGQYDGWDNVVELFNTGSRSWSQLESLPESFPCPSTTICNDRLYVIGHYDIGYSCSLEALLSSNRPIGLQLKYRTLKWTPLPRLPVTRSTAATLCGQLVIIGGRNQDESAINSIHQLMDRQWIKTGAAMSSGRFWCLVASPTPEKMVVVGGKDSNRSPIDRVEVCHIPCST